jgi:hypothetical protein
VGTNVGPLEPVDSGRQIFSADQGKNVSWPGVDAKLGHGCDAFAVIAPEGLQAAGDLAREKIQHMRELDKVGLQVLQGHESLADGLNLASTVEDFAVGDGWEWRHIDLS